MQTFKVSFVGNSDVNPERGEKLALIALVSAAMSLEAGESIDLNAKREKRGNRWQRYTSIRRTAHGWHVTVKQSADERATATDYADPFSAVSAALEAGE